MEGTRVDEGSEFFGGSPGRSKQEVADCQPHRHSMGLLQGQETPSRWGQAARECREEPGPHKPFSLTRIS